MERVSNISEIGNYQRISLFGKGFYIVEALILLLLIFFSVVEYNYQIINTLLAITFVYYSLGTTLFILFSNAFSSRIDKLAGILPSLATAPIILLLFDEHLFQEIFPRFGILQMLLAFASFVFYLLRLILAWGEAPSLHYLGMLVRLGLLISALFVPFTYALHHLLNS